MNEVSFDTEDQLSMCRLRVAKLQDRITELEAQLAAVREICESRLGSMAYTDAISDIHKAVIGEGEK